MKTLSQPLRLADLHIGDHFYFAAEVFLKVFFPTITEWEFLGPVSPGIFGVSLVEHAPTGQTLKAESGGEIRVVRINDQQLVER